MDAKVRELLNKVKEGALTYGKAASRFAQDTAEKARINLQIFDLNTEIDVAYKEIGKLVYAMHAGEDVCNEAIQSQIEAIDTRNVQLTELRGRLAAYKAAPAAEEPCEEPEEKACCCKDAEKAEEACECTAEKVEEACECAAEKVEAACECVAEKAEEACECAAEKAEEACCCSEKKPE